MRKTKKSISIFFVLYDIFIYFYLCYLSHFFQFQLKFVLFHLTKNKSSIFFDVILFYSKTFFFILNFKKKFFSTQSLIHSRNFFRESEKMKDLETVIFCSYKYHQNQKPKFLALFWLVNLFFRSWFKNELKSISQHLLKLFII